MFQKVKEFLIVYKDPIFVFLLIRIAIFILASFAVQIIPAKGAGGPLHLTLGNLFLDPWTRWDGERYMAIVEEGYKYGAGFEGNTHFFPLFPILVWVFKFLIGDASLAGVILSNVFFFLSLLLMYKMVTDKVGSGAAFKSIFYLSIFPASLFFSAMYTESLFLLLSLLVFYFADRGKWLAGGIASGLASATRPMGVLFLPILLLAYLADRGYSLRRIRPDVLKIIVFAPLGLLLFMLYQRIIFGSPFVFLKEVSSSSWGRHFVWPWDTLLNTDYSAMFGLDFVRLGLVLLFLYLSLIVYRKLGLTYCLYVLLGLLFPLSTGTLASIERYLAVLFPAFVGLALEGENRLWDASITVISIALLAFNVVLFSNWYWVA